MASKKINLTSHFEQAGQRYRSLSKVDQDQLVDPEFGKRVEKTLKL
ncbi:MAG: hypothetical protein J5U17_02110 [Candidatus Methanoperedens sp.]|nr:hypothetical protein [Candidatus Methanoperedens sp.]MCE8424557.1 hypothetical protein [Candidatus Methanoperedens sp.]MCE8429383.1 hypothetical protein [Candidatus Methanoperedens sp.]